MTSRRGSQAVRRGSRVLDATGAVAFRPPAGVGQAELAERFVRDANGANTPLFDRCGRPLPRQFTSVSKFSEGLAAVHLDPDEFKWPRPPRPNGVIPGKWGFIDETGELVVPIRYTSVGHVSHGRAPVDVGTPVCMCTGPHGGAWGYIDRTGKMAIKTAYSSARDFSDGVAWVTINASSRLIDPTGKVVLELPAGCHAADFREGLAAVNGPRPEAKGLLGFLGCIDKTGRTVVPPRFARVNGFSEGLAAAQANPTWDEQAKTWTQGEWGYIDTRGEWVIPPQFRIAQDLSGGLAWVETPADGFGYVDRRGRRLGWCPK
jgi:hypothetical protein